MKVKDKISVIISIYNSEKVINRCVDSILKQTYKNLEIILVDDGSTDNSPKICDQYKKKDKRVKVYHKKNGGVSSARNLGLDESTGEYISFIDSDDYIEDNMYEVLIDNIHRNSSDIAICNMLHEDNNNNILHNFNHYNFEFNRESYPEYSYFIPSISGYVCNKIYSKDIIYYENNTHVEFDSNITIAEDDLFNYEVFEKNEKIKYSYINDKLYHYVFNREGAINNKFNIEKLTYFDSKEKEISILENNNLNNDFLKADYIINQVRTKIIMDKLKIYSNQKFEQIIKKSDEYIKKLEYANLKFNLKIKLFIVNRLPIIYKLKLRNKFN